MTLPVWDFEKALYTAATLDITYRDQYYLDIHIFADYPAGPQISCVSYNIHLGTVPYTTPGASGTAQFNLLDVLSDQDFSMLFKGQTTLYLMADCHYIFDKACLNLEAVPIPATLLLFGSGLLAIIGIKRRLS